MKTERRHELKENDLVHWLEQGRDYAGEHAKQITTVVFGVVLVVVAVSVFARSRSASIEDLWRRMTELKFDTAEEAKTGLKSLKELGQNASDPAFALSSFLQRGAVGLKYARQGANGVADKEFNDQAREAFEDLLKKSSDNVLAFGSAHSGLATVEENAFVLDGNPAHKEEARKHLKAILDRADLNTTPFHRLANDRLASLDMVFQKVVFAPAPPPPPPTPGAMPGIDPPAGAPIKIDDPSSPKPVQVTPLPGPPPGFENVPLPKPASPPPPATQTPPTPPPPAPAPAGEAKPEKGETPKEGEKPKENP